MLSNLPSLKIYTIGLIVSLMVFGIFYFLVEGLNLVALSPMTGVLVGLLTGHFLGYLISTQSDNRNEQPSRGNQNSKTKTIYVGNLPFKTTRYELKELFQPYGKVHTVRIMIDKATRKPRGFGFVEMPHADAADAIANLDGVSFIGRSLKISEAIDRS